MLTSINFLFLTSLAITSWIILCYMKQLEDRRIEDLNAQFPIMEKPFDSDIKQGSNCHNSYDLYLNFLCIFACIYALAKVTSITENYITRRVQSRLGKRNPFEGNKKYTPRTIEEYKEHLEYHLEQMSKLEQQNSQLSNQLKELNQRNFLLAHGKGSVDVNSCKQNPIMLQTPNIQEADTSNMFSSKSNFHLNRQVYINEGNTKLNLSDTNSNDEKGHFTQIWGKYLDMQKYVIQKPDVVSGTECSQHTAGRITPPLILSTEDLINAQGLC